MSSPFLMLPLFEENSQETNRLSLSLYSLKDKKSYNLNLPENLENSQCVGSSHGWLAFDDEKANLFLLINPFSKTPINLPPKQTLPHKKPTLPKIYKLVLSKNPSSHRTNYAAVVMHSFPTKIAFCRDGDEEWQNLDCEGEVYDVVCCDKTNALLALGPGPRVESWDLNETTPKKTTIIQDSCPRTLKLAHKTFPTDLYSSQWYAALSPAGEIFMIVRYIGEFVRDDGRVVYEGDTLTDYAAEPLVCPYRTVGFRVFKVGADRREWVDVECLDDFVLFLGGNQSLMVSGVEHAELKRNAIYFTDDYWSRIDEDYSYGGHDLGVFSMGDGSIEQILEFEQQKIEPPPFWITLNSSR